MNINRPFLAQQPVNLPNANRPELSSDKARPVPNDSVYDPPLRSDPGTDPYRTKTEVLHDDGQVKITRNATWNVYAAPPEIKSMALNVQTGEAADIVHVSQAAVGRLDVQVNGKSYPVDGTSRNGRLLNLEINTYGGNDRVSVGKEVPNPVTVDGGSGDDTLSAGGGNTRLLGSTGNDILRLGPMTGYAEGNDGDDTIIGGSGNVVMYGGRGDDRLYAGAGPAQKQSYLDGGSGNDQLYAGSGHTVLHGGKGDDRLSGYDRTTFYTGKGQDQVWNNRRGDLIYADSGDTWDFSQGSRPIQVKPSTAGDASFNILGTPEFKQRVNDDLEFLRGSVLGQKMLADMDREAPKAGAKVTIREETLTGNTYTFDSAELYSAWESGERNIHRDDPRRGKIHNNHPGSRADAGVLKYERMKVSELPGQGSTPPVVVLAHEIGHAYNGATGTNLTGETVVRSPSQPDLIKGVHNSEFQVVGLPSNAQPFDFDSDPSTPPTTINPEHFTENGMNREMGRPERKTYIA